MTYDEYISSGGRKYIMPGQFIPEPPEGYTWKPIWYEGVLKMYKLWEIEKKSCGC
jgi:hypothetical protein